jgi:hypothetical protein
MMPGSVTHLELATFLFCSCYILARIQDTRDQSVKATNNQVSGSSS